MSIKTTDERIFQEEMEDILQKEAEEEALDIQFIYEEKFFAAFRESHQYLVMFKTKQERDDWVNFRDEISVCLKETPENAFFQRMAVSSKAARDILGDEFDCRICYEQDEYLPGAWCIRTTAHPFQTYDDIEES